MLVATRASCSVPEDGQFLHTVYPKKLSSWRKEYSVFVCAWGRHVAGFLFVIKIMQGLTHLFSKRLNSIMKFPATRWYFPAEEQRDEGCLPTALISFGSFAEGEEERAAEAASRSINKKEVTLPAVRVPHARPPGGHRRGPTRGSGTRALLPLQPRQGRLVPYRERNAGSHGAGASAQKNRLLGFEFLHPFSCQAATLFHGSYSARAQAFASGKVSWVSPGVTWSMQPSSGRAASLTCSRVVGFFSSGDWLQVAKWIGEQCFLSPKGVGSVANTTL